MNRLQPVIDLSYGEQEVLQRILGESQKIANALAPYDVREHSRIVGVLEELTKCFAPEFFKQHEYDAPEPELDQQKKRGISR